MCREKMGWFKLTNPLCASETGLMRNLEKTIHSGGDDCGHFHFPSSAAKSLIMTFKQIFADSATLKSCKIKKEEVSSALLMPLVTVVWLSSFCSLSPLTKLGKNTVCVFFLCLYFCGNRMLQIHKSSFECAIATATLHSVLILFFGVFVILHIFLEIKRRQRGDVRCLCLYGQKHGLPWIHTSFKPKMSNLPRMSALERGNRKCKMMVFEANDRH